MIDAIKLPHHGSKKNITKQLVNSVNCKHWLFSTDGTRFEHPDSVSVARVLHANLGNDPILHFNVPSEYNLCWDNTEWHKKFGYTAKYGNDVDGLVLSF